MSRTPKNIALVPFRRGLAFLSLVALSLSWSPPAVADHKPNHGGGGKPGGGENEASSVDVTVFGDMFGDTRRTGCVSKSSFALRDSHVDLSFLIPLVLFPCFTDPAEISPQVLYVSKGKGNKPDAAAASFAAPGTDGTSTVLYVLDMEGDITGTWPPGVGEVATFVAAGPWILRKDTPSQPDACEGSGTFVNQVTICVKGSSDPVPCSGNVSIACADEPTTMSCCGPTTLPVDCVNCQANMVMAAIVAPDRTLVAEFLRGDCSGNGTVDIADAICTLNWLFVGGATPGCVAATNTNGDGAADISDATHLLNYLFLGGSPPPEPFPHCGPGELPADEALGCETSPKSCE